jgi:hypothetical protein
MVRNIESVTTVNEGILYWKYFKRGLNSKHKGESYIPKAQHDYYLSLINSEKEDYKIMGMGYWNGYNIENGFLPYDQQYKSTNKRNNNVRLNVLCVDEKTVNDLHRIANWMCVKLPRARVMAYQEFIEKHMEEVKQKNGGS